MNAVEAKDGSKVARVGWGILFAISMLLVLYGVFWVFFGPEVALESIAERTSLTTSEFQVG
ncbi:MAG: hypothetical protein R3300_20155, partial [Candidatus Promineifilaceae bacterium]|nr:hypothetical protein [Candidatus Promineifilaceae bacterium]